MKIAVIGVGGSGAAALRFLAKAGHEVTGYEQFGLRHAMGSSHGHSRIIRYSYPDIFHTRQMAPAYALWNELEQEYGSELFVRCGGITFGPDGSGIPGSTGLWFTEYLSNKIGRISGINGIATPAASTP